MDSLLFGGLAIVLILLPAGQSDHIINTSTCRSCSSLLEINSEIWWQGEVKPLPYYLQLSIRLSTEIIISQEQKPLLNKTNLS